MFVFIACVACAIAGSVIGMASVYIDKSANPEEVRLAKWVRVIAIVLTIVVAYTASQHAAQIF